MCVPNIHEKLESKPNNFGSQGEGVAGAYIMLSTLGTTRKRISITFNSQLEVLQLWFPPLYIIHWANEYVTNNLIRNQTVHY